MKEIFEEIKKERERQDEKWGVQEHPPIVWNAILGEEAGEVSKAALESMFNHMGESRLGDYRKELVQTAAVCVAAIQCLDRGYADSHEDDGKSVGTWKPTFGENSKPMYSETGIEYEVITTKGNVYVGLAMDWGFVPNGEDDENTIEENGEQIVFFKETGNNLYEQ